jgi:putative membrane protein
VEHSCFLSTSILLWWPIVQPLPSTSRWTRWSIPAYPFFAMIPGTALRVLLAFCDRDLYPYYNGAPQILGLSPLSDQIVAGALMWVLCRFVFVVPAVSIVTGLLSPAHQLKWDGMATTGFQGPPRALRTYQWSFDFPNVGQTQIPE